jgi:hypothetical protein
VKNPVSDHILGRVPSTLVPVVDFANSICYYPAPILIGPAGQGAMTHIIPHKFG